LDYEKWDKNGNCRPNDHHGKASNNANISWAGNPQRDYDSKYDSNDLACAHKQARTNAFRNWVCDFNSEVNAYRQWRQRNPTHDHTRKWSINDWNWPHRKKKPDCCHCGEYSLSSEHSFIVFVYLNNRTRNSRAYDATNDEQSAEQGSLIISVSVLRTDDASRGGERVHDSKENAKNKH